MLLLGAALFAWTFTDDGGPILSHARLDLDKALVHWRAFAAREILQGNLPLWNPHVFCGSPFATGFQAAIFYPLNVVFLLAPTAVAMNLSLVLHLFLAGLFMYAWMRFHLTRWWVCLTVGILFACCGAYFPRLYAGHVGNLCAMVWAPLILLCIDGWLDQRRWRWLLIGAAATAMQTLAGHPQIVFITGITAGLYALLQIVSVKNRLAAILGLIAIASGGIGMAAVQVLPGIAEASETARSGGMPFSMASTFSLPPENLLTLLLPGIFGHPISDSYWGRWYGWEMNLFFSVGALCLATLGACVIRGPRRWVLLICLGTMLLLSLGAYTPVHRFLYDYVPIFSSFRAMVRFGFAATLFALFLAGYGLDRIHRIHRKRTAVAVVALIGAMIMLAAAVIFSGDTGAERLGRWIEWTRQTKQTYVKEPQLAETFKAQMATQVVKQCLICAAILAATGALMLLTRRWRRAPQVLAMLACAEVLLFAWSWCDRLDPTRHYPPATEQLLSSMDRDDRILMISEENLSVTRGLNNIWGYDPSLPKRYSEFMTFTQGGDPDSAIQHVRFTQIHHLWRMLRCRYVIPAVSNPSSAREVPGPLPRLLLIESYSVLQDRDDIFHAMSDDRFDPARHIILEQQPTSQPLRSINGPPAGTVRILNESTDHLLIEAILTRPAILLVTDAYSSSWHIRAKSGSKHQTYDLLPANYVLRAVPLDEGVHRFEMVYTPRLFTLGVRVTTLSVVCWLGIAIWRVAWKRRRQSSPSHSRA